MEILDIFDDVVITEKQAEVLYNDAKGDINEIRKLYEEIRYAYLVWQKVNLSK